MFLFQSLVYLSYESMINGIGHRLPVLARRLLRSTIFGAPCRARKFSLSLSLSFYLPTIKKSLWTIYSLSTLFDIRHQGKVSSASLSSGLKFAGWNSAGAAMQGVYRVSKSYYDLGGYISSRDIVGHVICIVQNIYGKIRIFF
jgi:hypothetical protein